MGTGRKAGRFLHQTPHQPAQRRVEGMDFPAGVLEGGAEAAEVGRSEGGGFPGGRPRRLERQTANGGRRTHVLEAAMHQAGRHYQEVPAMQLNRGLAGELVGGGPVEEEEEFKAFMGMPRHTVGNVAADPADMDEHRQADLLAKYRNRLVTHTYQRHFEARRLAAAFNGVQRTVKEHRIRQRCIKPGGLRTVPVRSGPGSSPAFWFFKQSSLFLRAASRGGSRSEPALDAAARIR